MMTIPSRAHTQRIPLIGIDSGFAVIKNIQPEFKKWVKQQHIGWIGRYGPRQKNGIDHKIQGHAATKMALLSVEEADFLRGDCGLMILPIQCKPRIKDTLNKITGKRLGTKMAKWAKSMGIPKGVHLWCDLEGKATVRAKLNNCIEYVNAWAASVTDKNYGYKAGLYTARSLPNGWTTSQLSRLEGITCFWQSGNTSAVPCPTTGCSIKQSLQTSVVLNKKRYYYDPDIIYLNHQPPVLWA